MASETIIQGRRYVVKIDHRDGTTIKSQWTVPVKDEHRAFGIMLAADWTCDTVGWSLHIVDGKAQYLGRSAHDLGRPARMLFIAFYVIQPICHGYPSDPQRSKREAPPDRVRNAWLQGKYLRAVTIRKLGRGQPCKL